jgi:hypothetical protein
MPLLIKKYISVTTAGMSINGNLYLSNNEKLGFGKFIRAGYKSLNIDYPKFFKMDCLSKLGFLSAEILLFDEDLSANYSSEKTGFIIANTSSSIEIDIKHQETIRDRNKYFPSPSNFVYTLPNIMAGEAAIRHGIKGENTVMISNGFDAGLIHSVTSMAFSSGALHCCISGWVEQHLNHYESLLFLVISDDRKISAEDIIFEPANLINIYKQEIEWKT